MTQPTANFKKTYSKFIKMEDIVLDTPYAITVNMSDKVLKKQEFISDYKVYNQCLDKLYSGILGLSLQFFPEFSQKGRLHIHGIVIFKNVLSVARFYQLLPQLIHVSDVKIDTINDIEVWKVYLWKQKHIMYPYCKHHKVPYAMRYGLDDPRESKNVAD